MEMKLTINFAVVGCGTISDMHFNAIETIDDAYLIGVFDTDQSAADKAKEKYNCKKYDSYEQLLNDEKVDVVCICTPSFLHSSVALQALNAKKNVLVEKPLALNVEDCEKLIYCAKKMNVQLGVVSQLRFSDSVNYAKKALEKGLLGRITRADLYMKYYRPQEYYDTSNWRGTWQKDGGGALMNQGIHGVDLLLYLMGKVKSVYALSKTQIREIEVEDTLSAVVAYENGAIGVIEASTADWPGAPRRLEINGEYGVIIMEEDLIVKFEVEGQKNFNLYEQKKKDASTHNDHKKIDPQGHIKQLKNFISAVRGDTELLVKGKDGKAAVELIAAAYRSSEEGIPIWLEY